MKLTRRTFLQRTVAASAGLCLPAGLKARAAAKPKIQTIETIPLIYPTIGRFKFFEGPKGRATGRPAVLVKITAENGVVGWGQSVPIPKWSYETLETVHSTISRYLAPELIGLDPSDDKTIQAVLQSNIAPTFSTGQPICKAGLDLALADLNGKLQ
ncbi:MAG: hypothetical protein KBH45_08990, partial [Verrucomicrobia bacterium]|nr:hypothetical protein [Verrucomicrobiota bacterium]